MSLKKFNDYFCELHNIDSARLSENDRRRESTLYRHAFCYYANKLGYNNTQIADCINRDHSTVNEAINKFHDKVEYDPLIQQIIDFDALEYYILKQLRHSQRYSCYSTTMHNGLVGCMNNWKLVEYNII